MNAPWPYDPASPDPGYWYVPTQTKRLWKPLRSEADSVILDLEDGCPADEKDEARKRVVEILNTEARAWVRINAITTEHWWNDVKGS